jgi:hypothetical protein
MATVEVFDAERLEALSAKFSGTLVQPETIATRRRANRANETRGLGDFQECF